MSERRKPQAGDWVRFRLGGVLVIGVVQYVTPSEFSFYDWLIHTDVGETPNTAILELRGASR